MKKIPSLFIRDFTNRECPATDNVTPGCEWVQRGEGVATRKLDGTSCMIKDGVLYKRFDAKKGKAIPEGAIPCQEADTITGHHPHWVPCHLDDNADQYHYEGYERLGVVWDDTFWDGTYELCGPKVNGNKEAISIHYLYKHGSMTFIGLPTNYEGMKWLFVNDKHGARHGEGVVWHHQDGRMCKIKRSDFGLDW
jgi:hypothetical protein